MQLYYYKICFMLQHIQENHIFAECIITAQETNVRKLKSHTRIASVDLLFYLRGYSKDKVRPSVQYNEVLR